MIKSLEQKIDKIDEDLRRLFDYCDRLDPERLHSKPDGKWSAAQIVQHLNDSEKGTVAYLSRKLQAPHSEIRIAGFGASVRSAILRLALRSTLKKYKAPSVLGEPVDKPDYPALRTEYLETRKILRSILANFDQNMLEKEYFKHPFAGRLTIGQALRFLEDHLARHSAQIHERSATR